MKKSVGTDEKKFMIDSILIGMRDAKRLRGHSDPNVRMLATSVSASFDGLLTVIDGNKGNEDVFRDAAAEYEARLKGNVDEELPKVPRVMSLDGTAVICNKSGKELLRIWCMEGDDGGMVAHISPRDRHGDAQSFRNRHMVNIKFDEQNKVLMIEVNVKNDRGHFVRGGAVSVTGEGETRDLKQENAELPRPGETRSVEICGMIIQVIRPGTEGKEDEISVRVSPGDTGLQAAKGRGGGYGWGAMIFKEGVGLVRANANDDVGKRIVVVDFYAMTIQEKD